MFFAWGCLILLFTVVWWYCLTLFVDTHTRCLTSLYSFGLTLLFNVTIRPCLTSFFPRSFAAFFRRYCLTLFFEVVQRCSMLICDVNHIRCLKLSLRWRGLRLVYWRTLSLVVVLRLILDAVIASTLLYWLYFWRSFEAAVSGFCLT